MPQYKYQPLEADEIRLLELYAGDVEADLEGSLHTFRLPEDDELPSGHEVLLTRDNGFDVPNAPQYEALSYTWGAGSDCRHSLRIIENNMVSRMEIRPNLDEALRRLKKDIPPDESRLLWIDAVCINQADFSEKSSQIPKMAMIYNRAHGVLVWLGGEDEENSRAVEFVERLLNLDNFDPLTKDPGTPAEWDALLKLMQRPWFSRRWIVQEISLARFATLFIGPESISWQDFSAAVALFVSRCQDLFQRSNEFYNYPNYLGEVDALGAKSLVDLTSNLFRKSEKGAVLERLLSLEALISTMTAFEATSPHDTIYAVLWLAHDAQPNAKDAAAMSEDQLLQTPQQSPQLDPVPSDEELSDCGLMSEPATNNITYRTSFPRRRPESPTRPANTPISLPRGSTWLKPPPTGPVTSFTGRSASDRSLRSVEKHFKGYPEPITVDYNKSVFEVCRDFLEFAISRSRTLDIACYPWAPEPPKNDPELPSWISRLSSAPFGKRPGQDVYGRVLADPLVGRPGHGPRNYNASGKTKTYPSKGFVNGRTLVVTGFVLDAIAVRKSPAYEGVIPATWLELVDWAGPPDRVPERLWRTLVADRGPDGRNYPPAYFPLACKWMFEQRRRRGSVNSTELLTSGRCPSIATEFLRRVQSVVWGRQMMLTEGRRGSKKLLGLVPAEAEEEDLICILYGCSVPVVLRRVKNPLKRSREENGVSSIDIVTTPPGGGPSLRLSRAPPPSAPIEFPRAMQTSPVNEVITSNAKAPETTTTDSMESLVVPTEPISLKHASAGLRRALNRENSERKPPNLTISLESQYQCKLIGECYIHGMMDGEAFKHQREHGNKLRLFNLF